MSLISMADIGISRDLAASGKPILRDPQSRTPALAGSGDVVTFSRLVAAQIPSESLLAYTTVVALFPAGGYEFARWLVWAAAVIVSAAAVIVAYLGRRQALEAPSESRKLTESTWQLPYLPAGAAAGAMAIYGLVVPGSALQAEMSPTGFPIAAACLAVGGGITMSMLSTFLGSGNNVTPRAAVT